MPHLCRYNPFPTVKKAEAEKGPWGNKQKQIGTNQIFWEAKHS